MSEGFPGSERTRFTISEHDVLQDRRLAREYFAQRLKAYERGEPVWMVMNFAEEKPGQEVELELVYIINKRGYGHVRGSDASGYIAYRNPAGPEETGSQRLTMEEDLNLRQAQIALEEYVQKNILPFE